MVSQNLTKERCALMYLQFADSCFFYNLQNLVPRLYDMLQTKWAWKIYQGQLHTVYSVTALNSSKVK